MSNITNHEILIGKTSSNFGVFGAVSCSVLGSLLNFVILVVILMEGKVRRYNASPLMFYHSLSLFIFSTFCLPIAALRFLLRETIFEHLHIDGCGIFAMLFFSNLAVSNWIVTMISLNHYLVAVK